MGEIFEKVIFDYDYLKDRVEQLIVINEGSYDDQKPLITLGPTTSSDTQIMSTCEEDTHDLVNENGCIVCRQCGWSKCD